jgi:hypothetical protein
MNTSEREKWKGITLVLVLVVTSLGVNRRQDPDIFWRFIDWSMRPNTPSVPATAPTSQTSGVIELDAYQWRGVAVTDRTKIIEGAILTSDVWWQVRLDRDDRKVTDLRPKNQPGPSFIELEPAIVTEWRILPGQTITKGMLAWEISPKSAVGESRIRLTNLTSEAEVITLTLNDTDWQGVTNFDASKKVRATNTTEGVRWQIRIDRDDRNIHNIGPLDSKELAPIILPDGLIAEYRVLPGQSVKRATLTVRLLPKTNN